MIDSESSALIALTELKSLEADRVAAEEAERQAREAAERHAREEAERRAREEAERRAREEAERIARETAEREAREREERIRVQEAEARARAEQEARLKEEQMRIDAQMRSAERKARPKWPLFVTPALALVVFGVAYIAYDTNKGLESEQKAKQELQQQTEEQGKMLAAIAAKLEKLESEQATLEKERIELDRKLKEVTDENERRQLVAKQRQLDERLEENKRQQSSQRSRRGSTKSSQNSSDEVVQPKNTGRKDKIELDSPSDDPLGGL